MRKLLLFSLPFFYCFYGMAQKKPLDHTVYDGWQSIGERMISNNGQWVVYTINVQQGDNELVIQSSDAKYKKIIPRGYNALITEDSRFVIFKIKPFYKETREARIKKKRPDEMPRDSFAIVELGKEEVLKVPAVKSYKTPEKQVGWVAYYLEKPAEKKEAKKTGIAPEKKIDSLNRIIDSLQQVIETLPKKKKRGKDEDGQNDSDFFFDEDAERDYADEDTPAGAADAGTDLVLRNLITGKEKIFTNVLEYYFSKEGGKLLIEQAKKSGDSLSQPSVLLYDLESETTKTLSTGGNEFKNFSFSEDGSQVAYVAERDAKPKDLQKFYGLWYYKTGMDSASLLADKYTAGMMLGMTVSEFGNISFSRNGKRLFFGSAVIPVPKDTTIIEIDMPKLDIWHYNDDYLQTVQTTLNRLRAAQQENFLTVFNLEERTIEQLGSKAMPQVIPTNEGDGDVFIGVTDMGKRIESQWTGNTLKDIYAIDVSTGKKKLVKENLYGQVYPSPAGQYIMWYDRAARHYFAWDGNTTRNISGKIKVPLWNEDSQVPDDPWPYGVMGWHEGDSAVYVYDRYDVWKVNLVDYHIANITKVGRGLKDRYRYVQLDADQRYISSNLNLLFECQNEGSKETRLHILNLQSELNPLFVIAGGKYSYGMFTKAKNSGKIIYTRGNFNESPDVFINDDDLEVQGFDAKAKRIEHELKISFINPQQKDYLWGNAELFKWKAYNGKEATGMVFKPEDFDPKKKYPVIIYFYEKLSDGLYAYRAPAPIRSAINVPYFVSNGYIIFMPDIHYTTGHPGKNAYDYIVSGARALAKNSWADSTRMALQGHSWGGYQAAQLATMTKMFKAFWAGAPVANMTSAYGGIRWGTGLNRQFQYEKTQSRIGATLWEKPALYIENSPLFHLDKVTAPMVILHNDADGAVPWYQGIELFTGLRRLGKKVWMFNYNGQDHGLTQRKDMLDYHIRMQQFFDWILKGDKPAKWITEGVPAVKKGKDWGLDLVD